MALYNQFLTFNIGRFMGWTPAYRPTSRCVNTQGRLKSSPTGDVNETLRSETETRPRFWILSLRRDRDLTKFSRDRDLWFQVKDRDVQDWDRDVFNTL